MASSRHEQTPDLSELRIVLLGGRWTGKSSAGNTILGREEFDTKRRTAQCVKRQREVAGRQVTVVDTPGWWTGWSVEKTPELVKQEIVHSVSLCPPGPCALFIVLRVDASFTETLRRSMEGHLELLSGTVWRHTIVLFTGGDWLGDRTIEQHIEAEGEALRWLVGKCGNRYHVLNNQKRADVTQVTELLEKVEEMVAGNSGRHFEIARMIIEKVEEKKRSVEEKAKQRMMKVENQRKRLRALFKEQTQHLSELRIVLLGGRWTGKSSAGNTILGREEFVTQGRTVQCVKRQREVAGRQVTVVDTPGWWTGWSVGETPEADKQEIVHSVSLCPPGPCALFIVLNVDASFIETERRSVEEHLELLSGTVWRHTIVLFTRGDWLGDRTIEQHIEAEGEALRWLVGKCGNRYHVLNNEKRGDVTQVTELLEKVEEMVAGNSGRHFEINGMIIEKVEEKKRSVEERAKQRMMKVENQKKTLRALFKEQTQDLSELRIVLLGGRWTGKSSAGNTILGREEFDTEGRTVQCVKRQREVAGRQVTVVDTPGWWMSWSVEETPEADKQEIVHSVSLCPPGPCALFIVLNVDASFTETHRRSVEEHVELLSGTVWRHTIVLFTKGDWLGDRTIEQHIEAEGEALRWLVGKCGNRYHVLNNRKRGDVTQVTELLEKVEEIMARNSGRHFTVGDREDSWEHLLERAGINKVIKQRIEEEWSRREEELIEKMSLLVDDESARKLRGSMSMLLNFSGESSLSSETGYSGLHAELGHRLVSGKVSEWMEKYQAGSSVSGYGSLTSAAPSEAGCLGEDGGRGYQLSDKKAERIGKNQAGPSSSEQTQDLSELRIVLLGGRWTGKSSAGNTILGREEFVIKGRTVQCVKRQREVAGRQVTVVDTPGWWKNWSVEETPEADRLEIVHSVSLCPPGPCALFIVLNVDASFTETHRRSVEEHLELLSGTVWRHTIVLFTKGDWLGDRTIEQHIVAEGEALRWLVGKCGNRYHVLNNEKRGDVTQVTELLEKVEEIVARNSGRHFTVGDREDSWEHLLERAGINKVIKQRIEEEWSRREEELIEKMSLLVDDESARKMRGSMSRLPNFSGESAPLSEVGSSVLDGELGHRLVSGKVSQWMEKYQAGSSVSGYGSWTSAAPSEAGCLGEDGGRGYQLSDKKAERIGKNQAGPSSSGDRTLTSPKSLEHSSATSDTQSTLEDMTS